MKLTTTLLLCLFGYATSFAQCPTCGNGVVDAGETSLNCPSDVPREASCISPCAQPGAAETTAGIRLNYDFTGTTTFSQTGLPSGWNFGSAATATTASALATAGTDAYGAKAGVVQPNGTTTGLNGFCIGNIANSATVNTGGTGGKLGANFDGRANVAQNTSYAVLRGTGNPTIVSPSYNMSAVEGFKIQFWAATSETSCSQSNSWGGCTGNNAYLDFSSNGGTSWTQIMTLNTSSANTDMCTSNNTNTVWLKDGTWSRICLTVFKSNTASGNYYPAASGSSAASGIMVGSTYFTNNFQFRVRYVQSASCTGTPTTLNPGRYLAVDYPVVTSGNEMIPCGISFANMCGYGFDNNDDGVGSSTLTTNSTAFGTLRRSVNHAERGVEIFNSQNTTFGLNNGSGSNLTSNYDLCNAEGGDQQCVDWQGNNNSYAAVYECITDWETSGISLAYYKESTPQSTSMSKVTTAGKTAAIGWRHTATLYSNCGSTSDLNPGCNGYLFKSGSLPTQFPRAFYQLTTNTLGQSWSFYGASSCVHYFNGPTFSPIAIPTALPTSPNYTICNGADLVFTADVDYCNSSSFTGSTTVSITGPGGFSETINGGSTGTTPITLAGEYFLTGHTPDSPTQCLDCGRTICVTVAQTDIESCLSALPVGLRNFRLQSKESDVELFWETESEVNSDRFEIERSANGNDFVRIGSTPAKGNSSDLHYYRYPDSEPLNGISYYRLKMIDLDGNTRYSSIISNKLNKTEIQIVPNPNNGSFLVSGLIGANKLELFDLHGKMLQSKESKEEIVSFETTQKSGIYVLRISHSKGSEVLRVVVE
ncbi:hypothetical protein D3C87_22210 [compost metagenome]